MRKTWDINLTKIFCLKHSDIYMKIYNSNVTKFTKFTREIQFNENQKVKTDAYEIL